ncbi:ABC transporter ATP-binding protein [Wenxinia marina]|uniref:ATPase component of various ABC-type transport system n=1 Tax=Wenxinia marina DSM 24838 TaxID=1123501 RepID=A0A0D0QA02_9RHOB|nr:ABC transporter ATP-binding protein [Wenxinia marina]KIQ71259.1 ATPase component of various ABC-type transport system [Wenxinia marina DSM 24838]GGL73249.1 ABC transporter ATP-binding protein [Wenxinia marina]
MANDDLLLRMRGVEIDGWSDERWHDIIKGVDLSLKHGEVLGLIGESGAGKSTLGLAAMGYARPGTRIKGGEIVFDGQDLRKLSERQKQRLRGSRIAYVAQSAAAAFNPAHTLLDQTTEVAVRRGQLGRKEAEAYARELYAAMDLPNPDRIGDRFPHQVSGGQLQRAMTAMAMASKPDLIIFDEPTTALDVTTQVNVLAAMRKAIEQFGTAAIYITHDLAVVAQMADRIKVLRYGEEVEEADTHTMLTAPKETYTRSLWAVRSLEKPGETSDDKILQIRNVTAAYGKVPVLKNVSIAVPRGKTVALVGESGSGKSTTARVVTGLLPPSRGEVLFDGEPLPPTLAGRSREQLRRIQMIYQMADTAMNPRQTVGEIIGRPVAFYHGASRSEVRARVAELLDLIELDESFSDRFPGELSGGQKQRICIARALAPNPDLIICDEVTSALDQIVQEGILKLLLRLQKELGVSYIFITHDIATVQAIADEVVVMYQGSVVEQGRKEEIFSPPHPDYTELLLSSVPKMEPGWLSQAIAERRQLTP